MPEPSLGQAQGSGIPSTKGYTLCLTPFVLNGSCHPSRTAALSDGPARRTRAASLEQVPISGLNVYATFGDRRWRWPVVDWVAAQVDWDAVVAVCDARDRKIVRRLATGMPQNRIARQLGIRSAGPPFMSHQHLRRNESSLFASRFGE